MKRHIVLAFTVALLGASPAAAADVRPASECFAAGEPLAFTGTGWTPGATLTLTDAAGAAVATAVVDETGSVRATGAPVARLESRRSPLEPPVLRRTPVTSTLTATDGTSSATTQLRVVNAGAIWSDRGQPRTVVRWQLNRLETGKPVYVHVRRGARTVRTTRVGRAAGPCGTASRLLRRLPVLPRDVRDGNYQIYVDNRRSFSLGGLQYVYSYDVSTTLRF